MKRLLSWLILATAVTALIFAVIILIQSRDPSDVHSASEIAERIRNLQTITTTEYRYRDVIYFGEESRFLGIPAGSRRILFSVSISILAGVDLARGVDVQLDETTGERVFVTLPAPEVIRVDAEERSITQYFVQERLGRIDWVEVSDEVEAAKERNRRDAIDRGMLHQAERQARAVVTRLLHAGGFSDVQIRFRPAEREITG